MTNDACAHAMPMPNAFLTLGCYKNEADQAEHLRVVLSRLREHKLYAKFSKCEF